MLRKLVTATTLHHMFRFVLKKKLVEQQQQQQQPQPQPQPQRQRQRQRQRQQ